MEDILTSLVGLCYNVGATQYNISSNEVHTLPMVKVHALFVCLYLKKEKRYCVAAIGALHFSVRGFGCALFDYKGKRMTTFPKSKNEGEKL